MHALTSDVTEHTQRTSTINKVCTRVFTTSHTRVKMQHPTHLLERRIRRVVMLEGGVVLPGVVRHQEGPAPEVALVAVAAVKHVAVEEQRVT